MAIWKRKNNKKKNDEDILPAEENVKEIIEESGEMDATLVETSPPMPESEVDSLPLEDLSEREEMKATDETSADADVASDPAEDSEQSDQAEPATESMATIESSETLQEESDGGVILRGKKITGVFRKIVWSLISIFILPPFLMFIFGILVIVFMLIFPIITVVLTASVPAVFATLTILIVAIPVLFPLLIIFLLITGKGKLLIGTEGGGWFKLEMFGKSYTIK